MGFDNYIAESEAIGYAGVSAATLKRFIEAGYLQVETDADGLRLFAKGELERLFGAKKFSRPYSSAATNAKKSAPVVSAKAEDSTPRAFDGAPEAKVAIPAPVTTSAIPEQPAPVSLTSVVAAPTAAAVTTAEPAAPAQPQMMPVETVPSEPVPSPAIELMEAELDKFRNLLALQEKLLDSREQEIFSLRSERDWLRSRIERLEEKGNRDQVLLLAETQTIRRLITMHDKKRTGVQKALEWFGFKDPPRNDDPLESTRRSEHQDAEHGESIDVTNQHSERNVGNSGR